MITVFFRISGRSSIMVRIKVKPVMIRLLTTRKMMTKKKMIFTTTTMITMITVYSKACLPAKAFAGLSLFLGLVTFQHHAVCMLRTHLLRQFYAAATLR